MVQKLISFFIFLFLSVTLSVSGSCANKDNTAAHVPDKKISKKTSDNSIQKKILKEFRKWEGTPHRMGGNSKKGIDCSGFAHYMYNKLFNIKTPRSTKLFLKYGGKIRKNQLYPGDIVIFRPPTYPYHVGIYVGENKFIHASTTKGVMMSDLDNPYWLKAYYMSRRVMSLN